MTTIIFDTLDFSKRAQEAGFTKEQADFQAREAANAIEGKIASKDDVLSVKQDLTLYKSELAQDLKLMEQRIIIRLGAMIVGGVGILLAFKFFHIT